jgi:hypothetical protein
LAGCQEQGGDEALHRAVFDAACSTPRPPRSGTAALVFLSQHASERLWQRRFKFGGCVQCYESALLM